MNVRLSRLGQSLLAAVLLVTAPGLAAAQTGTSSLAGTVTDDQKSAVPGAAVTVASTTTGLSRDVVTNENGGYQLVALPPGAYKVTVSLAGFKTSVVDTVQLGTDSAQRLDVVLAVGGIEESVQVQAEAPIINSTDASLGNVIGTRQILSLPLEARNPVGLLSLQTGVVFIPRNNPETTVDPRYGAVSGARADQGNVTLDGIDVNDGQNQNAFTSVLRLTLDSVQEFRVTTSSYGADAGRSSGPQVSLITKSGTNSVRGSGYYVNRDTQFSSNEYFNKLSQLKAGNESKPPLLNKNIFGGSVGGPIAKDRAFYFVNYEGLKEKRESVVERAVPSAAMRDGVLTYRCATASACPGGAVQGLANTHQIPAGSYGLTPAELRRVDPTGLGANLAASQYWQQYPLPNFDGRDGANIMGFRFPAPLDNQFNTYIARGDYRITSAQSLFTRFNTQRDEIVTVPQFPGSPANTTREVANWGFATGHDWVLGSNMVNTFRAGYTKIDSATLGRQTARAVVFRFLDNYEALTATSGRELGTFNVVNDFSWIKGSHTMKVGTNLRWLRNDTFTNASSFFGGSANGSWTSGVGRRYMPGGACPAPANCAGLPAVAANGQATYADTFINLIGAVTQTTARYNYTIDGGVLAEGAPLPRQYVANEYEVYVQDQWRIGENFTLTGGLRYSLFPPVYEGNGQQVVPNVNIGNWFDQRARNMAAGVPSSGDPIISFVPGGAANDGPAWYQYDKNNFAPRASFAWTVTPKTVVRGGYFLVYDRIGSGLATQFNDVGSFGLATQLSSPFGANNETSTAIRFRDIGTIPTTYPGPPPASFPATPLLGTGVITSAIDQNLRTPYSHAYNLTLSRDLGKNFSIDATYVGRQGRNLMVRRDAAMPLNLTDPASGVDYFTAANQLILGAQANGVANLAPIPYWENLFPGAARGGLTATQAMAGVFLANGPDYITALYDADQSCLPSCSRFGPFAYFNQQYDSLAVQSSLARSGYNSLQMSLRKRYSSNYQFDANYTYAVAKDHGSAVERGSSFGNFAAGGYSGFLVNSWAPDLQYSFADFDVRHQVNVNALSELPFGSGKAFGTNAGPVLNALIGNWSVSGIYRWTSGFPFNVYNCRSCWATNWNIQGNAVLLNPDRLPELERTPNAVGGQPSPYANATEALTAFRRATPGESGVRNLLRGDGYFGIDASLGKAFTMPFGHRLMFRWDVFNLTNSVRFDTATLDMFPDIATSFGRYNGTLAGCDGAANRCMQLNLRYEF
ncbi:MAG: carboxypeptidase regulatory-like domain-containing protein [Acidobacteria bacterium]|nr:carboxypeptidase regulatory-like domain-containing protein [Acidobacteriota bacterium]